MKYELLDPQKICFFIEPENRQQLSALDIFNTLDSTNSYLLSSAKKGGLSGSVCLAEAQTKGRGRRGRAWFSPLGTNIYCSMLWRFERELLDISSLSIAVAVMVAKTLEAYGIKTAVQLKWPNDVLVFNRKLAGILLECTHASVVIGIGLNVDVKEASEENWIDLAEITEEPIDRNRITGLLLNELLSKLPLYETDGLKSFLADWQKYDVLCNKAVTVFTPEKTITGVVEGINQKGELLLKDESGMLQSFCYGEVSVRW